MKKGKPLNSMKKEKLLSDTDEYYDFRVPADWEEFTVVEYLYKAGGSVSNIATSKSCSNYYDTSDYDVYQRGWYFKFNYTGTQCYVLGKKVKHWSDTEKYVVWNNADKYTLWDDELDNMCDLTEAIPTFASKIPPEKREAKNVIATLVDEVSAGNMIPYVGHETIHQTSYTVRYKSTDIVCLSTFGELQRRDATGKRFAEPIKSIVLMFDKGNTSEFNEFRHAFIKACRDAKNSKETSDTTSETPFDKVDEETSKKIQTRVFRRFLAIISDDPNSVEMYLTPRGEICAVTPKLGIGDIYEMFEDIGIDIATATDFTAKEAKHVTLDWNDARDLYNILDDILFEDGRSDLEVFGERGISFERLYDAVVGDVYDNKTIEREEEKELEQEEKVERERERDRGIYRSR